VSVDKYWRLARATMKQEKNKFNDHSSRSGALEINHSIHGVM